MKTVEEQIKIGECWTNKQLWPFFSPPFFFFSCWHLVACFDLPCFKQAHICQDSYWEALFVSLDRWQCAFSSYSNIEVTFKAFISQESRGFPTLFFLSFLGWLFFLFLLRQSVAQMIVTPFSIRCWLRSTELHDFITAPAFAGKNWRLRQL